VLKPCAACGAEFKAKGRSVNCKTCREKPRDCRWCGRQFVPQKGSRVFHARECYLEAHKEATREYRQTPGGKEASRKIMQKWRQRPGQKRKLKEYGKEYEQRPEVKEQRRIRVRRVRQTPEGREAHIRGNRKSKQRNHKQAAILKLAALAAQLESMNR
jgi:hypothetical protein